MDIPRLHLESEGMRWVLCSLFVLTCCSPPLGWHASAPALLTVQMAAEQPGLHWPGRYNTGNPTSASSSLWNLTMLSSLLASEAYNASCRAVRSASIIWNAASSMGGTAMSNSLISS